MSDDQLPTRAELASAYLDGELEAAEGATVASDPDGMAMVDSFARIRTELNTAQPVDDAARSAAVAAALAEFDLRHDTTSGGAVVTPLQSRRPRGYRVLTGVAAAVVIAVVGIAALKASSGNNENDSSAAVAPAETAEPPQLKVAAADNAAGGTAAPSGTVAAGSASIESAVTSLPEINSKEELQAFAAAFQGGPTAAAPAPAATTASAATPEVADSSTQPACVTAGETELGRIVYRGTVAVVVRVDTTGIVEAMNSTDCTVLETAP